MKGFKDWTNTQPKQDLPELERIWEITGSYKNGYRPNTDKAHDKFMKNLHQESDGGRVVALRSGYKLWRIAAVFTLLAISGLVLNNFLNKGLPYEQIITSESETKDLSLTDGTIVNLNENSVIDFMVKFEAKERKVKLKGEAFFNVARDENKPFLIETEKAIIKVLGTSFNVRSYPDENRLEVFVSTGSVEVTIKSGEQTVLNQGDIFTYDFDKKSIDKEISNPENANAWKSGQLRFKKEPLDKIFKTLERIHGITILTENQKLNNCPFTISLNSLDLKNAFEGLEVACDLTFINEGDKVYHVNGTCCE
ncbi:MAG: FecR domain-containing protein [Saprospiraceae bacterium]